MAIDKITNAPTPNEQIDKINELIDDTNTNSGNITTINGNITTINNTLSAKENTSNKVSSITNTTSTTLYPNNKAVVDYVAQASSGAGLPIGTIIPAYGPISNNKFLELNGQTINPSNYQELDSYLSSNNLLLDSTYNLKYIEKERFKVYDESAYWNLNPSTLEYDNEEGLIGFSYGNYYFGYDTNTSLISGMKYFNLRRGTSTKRLVIDFTINSLGANSNTTSNIYSDYTVIIGCDQYKGLLVRFSNSTRKLNIWYTSGSGSSWKCKNKTTSTALEYNTKYRADITITTNSLAISVYRLDEDSQTLVSSDTFSFSNDSSVALYTFYLGYYSEDEALPQGYGWGLEVHDFIYYYNSEVGDSLISYKTGLQALNHVISETGSNGWFYKRNATELIVPNLTDVVMYGGAGSIADYRVNKGSVPNVRGGMLNIRTANSSPYSRCFGGIRGMGNNSNYFASGDSDRHQAILDLRGGSSYYSYVKDGVHPNNFKVRYYIVAKS